MLITVLSKLLVIEQTLARVVLKLALILNLKQERIKVVTLLDGRVSKLKEVSFKYRLTYDIYEPIIIILDNMNNTNIFVY